jgi:hypothetical protein
MITLHALRIAAHVEFLSLLILLINLATAHYQIISSVVGPTHGCAYLFVIIATWRHPQANVTAKLGSLVPGIGGLFAVWKISANKSSPKFDSQDRISS